MPDFGTDPFAYLRRRAVRGGGSGGAVAPEPEPSNLALNVFIDSDIDTVGERDDISAMALWLASQEHFNIVGLTASAPDSNSQEYLNDIAAYGSDRPVLLTKTAFPERFKTTSQLNALVRQGSVVDAPAKGYWEPGDAGYAAPHACAQDMIAAAQTYGSVQTPLWVIIQGGYTTLAQAAYEAVVLGQLPDFFQRIKVIGQPNYNSWWAPNAWNYLFGNIWPAAGTPGVFGDAWMLNGYLQWHAFNRDNGTTDTTFWNEIAAESAIGAHLRATLTRPGGTFTTPHFRAGDAGAWFWLLSAKLSGNFDPANPDNWCGKYRTYAGTNPWPSRTVGYGTAVQPGTPNPQGVTYSTTMWAPELTVTSEEAALTAVNLSEWYNQARAYMYRYQTGYTITASAPTATEGDTITFTMTSRTPGETVTVTLSGVSASDIVGGNLTPSVTFDGSGNATLNVTIASDGLTETAETLKATVGIGSVSASVIISDAGGSVQPAFLDEFAGTDGAVIQVRNTDSGHVWTKIAGGNFRTQTGAAYSDTAATFYTANYDSPAQSMDIDVEFVYRGTSSGNVYVLIGYTDASNYISIGINSGNWRIQQKIAGTTTILGTASAGTLVSGTTYTGRAEVRGANITLAINGTTVASTTAAPIMTGKTIGLEGGTQQTSTTRMHLGRLRIQDV